MEIILLVAICIGLGGYVFFLSGKAKKLENDLRNQVESFEKERESIKVAARKRTGAVKWGNTIEKFVPFLDDFPIPPEDVVFLGKPIDFVGFLHTTDPEKCEVHFVEVKSGGAFLLDNQKNIKKAVEEKRVFWHEIRVKSNKIKDTTYNE